MSIFSISCYKKTDSMQESVFIWANYESKLPKKVGEIDRLPLLSELAICLKFSEDFLSNAIAHTSIAQSGTHLAIISEHSIASLSI